MRFEVDRAICIGSGQCVVRAPTVFDQDDDEGLAVVLEASPGPELQAAVIEAVKGCPSGAISVVEE